MELFIIVVNKEGKPAEMISRLNADEVLQFIKSIGAVGDSDPRTVQRVFSVDTYGNKTAWNIVFYGKLKLEREPVVCEG